MTLHVVGAAVALVGAAIGLYGLAMFVDYRGAATHYWWRVWRSHERWNPYGGGEEGLRNRRWLSGLRSSGTSVQL